jgi:hypothetical protein
MIRDRLLTRLVDWIWSTQAGNLPLLGGWAVRTARLLHAVIRDAAAGQINLENDPESKQIVILYCTSPEERTSEQVANMDIIQRVEHDLAGQIPLIGPAISMTQTPQVIRRSPPLLAQHTAEVLGELGYSSDEISQLASSDAVMLGPVTRVAQS